VLVDSLKSLLFERRHMYIASENEFVGRKQTHYTPRRAISTFHVMPMCTL